MPLQSAELTHVTVERGGRAILEDVSLAFPAGRFSLVLGPNGSGKSTLARVLLGLERPSRGEALRARKGVVGFVPQHIHRDGALPLSTAAFLAHGAPRRRAPENEPQDVLAELGVRTLLPRPVAALSGGELRRAALARALLRSPDLLVLDEPLAGVDYASQSGLYAYLKAWQARRAASLVLIAHEIPDVLPLADHAILIDRRVVAEGTPAAVAASDGFRALYGPTLQTLAREALSRSAQERDHG